MGFISGLLNSQHTIVLGIVVVLVTFNALITLVKKVADRYFPASKFDGVVGVIAKYLGKALEFISANSTVLPKDAQDELSQAKAEAQASPVAHPQAAT